VDESKRKRTVCVHWLSNQCKKGDNCEFLHIYDPDKIPPCRFFQKDGTCHKGDKCTFQHIRGSTMFGTAAAGGERSVQRMQEHCPYFERGFCKLNWMQCQFIHDFSYKVEICTNYMIGFCPKGPNCDKYHYKGGVLADSDTTLKLLGNFPDKENWSDRNALP
jgi:cleavage and polyadenylation specificity factor subunit 4